MEVSNVKAAQAGAYTASSAVSGKTEVTQAAAEVVSTDKEAATYASGGGHGYSSATRTGYTVDADTIERLKSENETRMANLVQQMLGKQISRSNILDAINAGKFSAEDIAQAQKDTAEDGYWGVEQTSDRLVKFAVALTGGDPSKLDSMIAAFEKGYAAAEKQWGGSLPALAQKTREATLKKFQDLKDQYANSSGPVAAAAQVSLESAAQAAMSDAE